MQKLGQVLAAAVAVALAAPPSRAAAADATRVMRLSIAGEPPQLSSLNATDQVSGFLLGHLMEGLTRYGKNDQVIPGIASSWRIDGLRATFHLREARWADGKSVTAHDFVFAWRTVVDPATASEYAFIMYPLKNAEAINRGQVPPTALGVRAVDDRTLEVELEKPCGYFLGLTAFPTYLPVREDFYRARKGRYAADARDLLSDGPFVLTSWVHGASLTLEKNPAYWDSARIRLDRIEIPYITSDNNARYNLFASGRIDMIGLDKDQLERAQAERLRMKAFADGSVFYMEFNFRPERATRSWHLRKAIQLAFDPRELVSRVVGIPGTPPGVSLIPDWVPGARATFREEHPIAPVRPDLAEARRQLELARRELGGTIPPLVWLTGDTPFSAREAEYFQYVFRTRLGISLRIDKQIFKQRLAKMTAGDFDIVSSGWGPDFADPMTFAELLASWNENNRGKYRSARYDELIRLAQATADPVARMNAMAEAERIALGDVAIAPMYGRVSIYAEQPRVHGIVRHVIGPDPDYTWATVDERDEG